MEPPATTRKMWLGGGNSNIFGIFTPKKIGEDDSHVDFEHIFQRGWFNHQPLVMFLKLKFFNHLDFQFSLDLQGPDFSWIDQIVGEDGLEAGGWNHLWSDLWKAGSLQHMSFIFNPKKVG